MLSDFRTRAREFPPEYCVQRLKSAHPRRAVVAAGLVAQSQQSIHTYNNNHTPSPEFASEYYVARALGARPRRVVFCSFEKSRRFQFSKFDVTLSAVLAIPK